MVSYIMFLLVIIINSCSNIFVVDTAVLYRVSNPNFIGFHNSKIITLIKMILHLNLMPSIKIDSFTHSFIHACMYACIHPFIHPSIHSSIHVPRSKPYHPSHELDFHTLLLLTLYGNLQVFSIVSGGANHINKFIFLSVSVHFSPPAIHT